MPLLDIETIPTKWYGVLRVGDIIETGDGKFLVRRITNHLEREDWIVVWFTRPKGEKLYISIFEKRGDLWVGGTPTPLRR